MTLILSLSVLVEIILLIVAINLFFYSKNYSMPSSLGLSILFTLVLYSILIQFIFIVGLPEYFFFLDAIIVVFSGSMTYSRAVLLKEELKVIQNFICKNKLYSIFFTVLLSYLFLQAFFYPPINWDSMTYNLARVTLYQNEGTLFLSQYSTLRQVVFPWGYDILHFLFLRFYSDFGLGIFGFLCYLTIIFGTYSIIKNEFADTKLALFLSFLVSSFSQIIMQATNTKNDIPLAAITVILILCTQNFLKNYNIRDLIIIFILAIFSLSIKAYYPAFLLPFLLLLIFYLIRNTDRRKKLFKSLSNIFKYHAYVIIAAILMVLLAIFYLNNINYGGISGPPEFFKESVNSDGLTGAFVNFGRYIIQFFNLPIEFFGKVISYFINNNLIGDLKNLSANPGMNNMPILSSTAIPDEDQAFYGIIGNIFLLPALLYSIFKENAFIKITALSILFFLFGICLGLKWDPWRTRFLISIFAGAGVCYAVLLYKVVTKKRFFYKLLTAIIICNLMFILFFNVQKPAPFVNDIIKFTLKQLNINKKYEKHGSWISWSFDRNYNYNYYFGENAIEDYQKIIKNGSRVLLITGEGSWIFPIMLRNPDCRYSLFKFRDKDFHKAKFNKYKNYQYLVNITNQKIDKTSNFIKIYSNQGHSGLLEIFIHDK